MTLSDLEWLSNIFNGTKRSAVSLRQLSFLLSNVTRFLEIVFGNLFLSQIKIDWNYHKFELINISQGSAATYWRYSGKYYVDFIGNLLLFSAVKEFWKSVKNLQSYRQEFGVLFLGTQCIKVVRLWPCLLNRMRSIYTPTFNRSEVNRSVCGQSCEDIDTCSAYVTRRQ